MPGLPASDRVPLSAPGQLTAQAQTSIHNADPSVIRVGSTYYSVESDGNNIYSRAATSVDGLGASARSLIWSAPRNMPNVWAPELVRDPGTGRFYVYFASGDGGAGQRMYVSESANPGTGFGAPLQMALPDNRWAIDGTAFFFNNTRWFVWSGWAGTTNGEQNLYIARMSSPTATTGARFIISQPREGWEQADPNPPTRVDEGPEAIIDPAGQLHIVYSANGSWAANYCLGDLRLSAGGDPTNVWAWYKSNGCLFGSNRSLMMAGWDPTINVNGPGHHSFVLLNGDPGTSPPAGSSFPLMYHAVPKSLSYSWGNRSWYSGSFMWWGNTTYSRSCCSGPNTNTGWSLKFFE
ncbi:glycoside hydrolase family 43 protein (plasmid) [Deinococcus sonorensis KR-87]